MEVRHCGVSQGTWPLAARGPSGGPAQAAHVKRAGDCCFYGARIICTGVVVAESLGLRS